MDGKSVTAGTSIKEAVRARWETQDARHQKRRAKTASKISTGEDTRPSGFNPSIKSLDPGKELVWAFKIPSEEVQIDIVNRDPPQIEATIPDVGTGAMLRVVIDTVRHQILHPDCDLFGRYAPKKKICRHIMKLFLLLRRDDVEFASATVETIAREAQQWTFQS